MTEPGAALPAAPAPAPAAAEGRLVQLASGLVLPLRAARLIASHLRLIKLAVLPVVINVLLFVAVFLLARHYWAQYIAALVPAGEGWLWAMAILLARVVVWVVGFVVYLALCFLLFTVAGNLVAAPFLDMLSERAEGIVLQRAETPSLTFAQLLGDMGALLLQEARKLALWLGCVAAGLPLLLVPVLGQVAWVALTTALTLYFLGLAFVDFPMTRRRLSFATKRAFAWRVLWRLLGFGGAVYLTLLVPVLGFLCLPLSAVGGTLLFCEHATDDEKRFVTE